jgi:hypothetical protein
MITNDLCERVDQINSMIILDDLMLVLWLFCEFFMLIFNSLILEWFKFNNFSQFVIMWSVFIQLKPLTNNCLIQFVIIRVLLFLIILNYLKLFFQNILIIWHDWIIIIILLI